MISWFVWGTVAQPIECACVFPCRGSAPPDRSRHYRSIIYVERSIYNIATEALLNSVLRGGMARKDIPKWLRGISSSNSPHNPQFLLNFILGSTKSQKCSDTTLWRPGNPEVTVERKNTSNHNRTIHIQSETTRKFFFEINRRLIKPFDGKNNRYFKLRLRTIRNIENYRVRDGYLQSTRHSSPQIPREPIRTLVPRGSATLYGPLPKFKNLFNRKPLNITVDHSLTTVNWPSLKNSYN